MKTSEIEIGTIYHATITGREAHVRIEREHESGGWVGTNLTTNRTVRIKSDRKLRGRADEVGDNASVVETVDAVEKGEPAEDAEVPTQRATKKPAKKQREAVRAQSKADQENARLRDERETSSDGMAASERAIAKSQPSGKKKSKKAGCLHATVQVLEEADEPLTCKQVMERILERGLWTTKGRTPAATLYSAMLREIQRKGTDARFVLAERGKFALNR